MYAGASDGRNGVAIVVKLEHLDNIIELKRVSDRLMYLKLLIEGQLVNIVAAYAPQAGCPKTHKDDFWSLVDDVLHKIPSGEITVLGGDLN